MTNNFNKIQGVYSYSPREMIKIIGTGTPQQTHKTRQPSEGKNRYLKTTTTLKTMYR